MRGITPRYISDKVVLGADIFPVDPGLNNQDKLKIQNPFASKSAMSAELPPAKSEEPSSFGTILGIGIVVGGIYLLAKNMGTRGEGRLT